MGVLLCCNPITIPGYGTDDEHDIDTRIQEGTEKYSMTKKTVHKNKNLMFGHLGKFGEVDQTEKFSVPVVHIYHKVIMHL